MNRISVIVYNTTEEKDDIGRVRKIKGKEKEIKTSFLLPITKEKMEREYGYSVHFAYRAYTFSKADLLNHTLEYQNKTYFIRHVIDYPTYNVLLLELIR